MSFSYRRKKRNTANFILEYLSNRNFAKTLPEFQPMAPATVNSLRAEYQDMRVDFHAASLLLLGNRHIIIGPAKTPEDHIDDLNISLTPNGEEAYWEGYYEKENQKDRLECIELYTKWILPIASFIISIVALLKK